MPQAAASLSYDITCLKIPCEGEGADRVRVILTESSPKPGPRVIYLGITRSTGNSTRYMFTRLARVCRAMGDQACAHARTDTHTLSTRKDAHIHTDFFSVGVSFCL